ncbi:MAG TPA: pitrilysin family protein [Verrucomicrobiae bacterium]|nr:pitrilysin family protein [Verrucomicrobiae bacterium]
MEFRHYVLDNGLNLYVLPTTKFKTVMLKAFWHQNLDQDAAKNALLAMILKRGTRQHPTSRGINLHLEELYGAEFDSRVIKKGERQIIEFELELVKDSLVNEPLLEKGLELLREILLDPLVNDEGFDPEYLAQEKEQLGQLIASVYNDKVQYSAERCLEELGKNERFGISRYGKVNDFPGINTENLYQHYLARRNTVPVDVFVVGDVNPEQVYSSVNKVLTFPRQGGYQLLPVEVEVPVSATQEIIEKQEVNQGKLCLAYRTNLNYAADDYPALVVCNGILGGFAHSKLFQNVREKESLAYYATSRLEKSKGILLIASGIEFANYHRAREIIEAQVADLVKGNITDLELENTKRALHHTLRAGTDNFHLMIDLALDGLINGRLRKQSDFAREIDRVTKADLLRVAEKIRLDTVYYLTNLEGAGTNG